MSKAFTREADGASDEPVRPRASATLPPGAKNYVTPGGVQRLREELEQLMRRERPRIAALPDENERKQSLQNTDLRIRHLSETIAEAVIVPPPAIADGVVRFGASVTVREPSGSETCYRIVGVDETDLDRDWVSWLSPIARALLGARIGQRVRFRFPAGEKELEIVNIAYE